MMDDVSDTTLLYLASEVYAQRYVGPRRRPLGE